MKPISHIGTPWFDEKFPVPMEKFPVLREKIPCSSKNRELACNTLKLQRELASKSPGIAR
jgi:hypothetical protein